MSAPRHDREQIERGLQALFAAGQVVEVRAVGVAGVRGDGTWSGYFNSDAALVPAVLKLPAADGVYVTLNRVDRRCHARRPNRLEPPGRHPTTGDNDIVRLCWLLVDADPKRPSGVSSTEEEHAAALALVRQIRADLRRAGWPDPIVADSGNGGHLLYRLDLAPAESKLIERVLKAFAFRYDAATPFRLEIDQKTFNPSRITKLYGTVAGKGYSTVDQPHRVSRILEAPANPAPVPRALLEALAATLPREPERRGLTLPRPYDGPFDVAAWLRRYGLEVERDGPWTDGHRWVLTECPFNADHRDRSAYIVQFRSGAVAAGCQHNSCLWDWRELRARYEPEYLERQEHAATESIPPRLKEGVVAESKLLPWKTAREIGATTPPVVDWLAEPWVAAGAITELDGKLKASGKTTWTLAMCRAIVDGLPFMGRPTTRTGVVYLTEQPARSFREGLRRAGLLDRADFHVLHAHDVRAVAWPGLVAAAIAKAKETGSRLLVVDTLPQFAGLRGDAENNAGAALAAMEPLQDAAAVHDLGILVARHERKSGGEVGDSGRGSSAFGGAVDIVLSLRRGEGNTRPTIRVINALSRFDETPDTLTIELDEATGEYRSLGEQTAVAVPEAMAALLAAAPAVTEAALTFDELLARAKNVKRTIGQKAVAQLVDGGQLLKVGAGKKGDPRRYCRAVPRQNDGAILSATTSPLSRGGKNPAPNGTYPDQEALLSATTTVAVAESNDA
jgi:hypothetical protein